MNENFCKELQELLLKYNADIYPEFHGMLCTIDNEEYEIDIDADTKEVTLI